MSRRSLSLAVSLGVFGGAVLVLSYVFFTPGKYLLIPYAAVVIAATVMIRAERVVAFPERFVIGLSSFMMASLALYVAVSFSPHTASLGVPGHSWRIAFLLVVGIAVNLPAARVASPRSSLSQAE
jgi:hypothetical protein